jgi:AcrR family transcriptional regulator
MSVLPVIVGTIPVRERILRQAGRDLFQEGYRRLTMDALARELGLSKKTLYVHFRGKDEIVAAVIAGLAAEVRREAEALLRERRLSLADKVARFVAGLQERLVTLRPAALRDLRRFAPARYAEIEEVRRTLLPWVMGRFLEEGRRTGMIDARVPAEFAGAYFLQAVQGLMQPEALERLRLAPATVMAHAVDLFFGGLLTPAGRKHHEKRLPR